jgi:hypothetical protein
VVVEQSDQMYGGTCPNAGCVPTKALVHEAGNRRPSDVPEQWYARRPCVVGHRTHGAAARQHVPGDPRRDSSGLRDAIYTHPSSSEAFTDVIDAIVRTDEL